MEISTYQPFGLAILVGLLVGIERERASPEDALGVRTFILLALLGALAGGMEAVWASVGAASFAFALVAISYIRGNKKPGGLGLTTEIAAGIVFFLGYLAHQKPQLVALLGPFVAFVLFAKAPIHAFARKIRAGELRAALFLLLLGAVVVSLLEDEVIDPWGIFNPHKFGILVLLLATLEFSSYIAVKFLGTRASSLLVGILGGLVSSTAVTLASARAAKQQPAAWRIHARATIAAQAASLTQLLLLVAFVSRALAMRALVPVAAAVFAAAILLWWLGRNPEKERPRFELKSPLDIRGVLRLSLLLGALLAAVGAAQRWLGDKGAEAMAFLGGLFELHGVSLATATLEAQGKIPLDSALSSLTLAVFASFVSKILISWFVNRGVFAKALMLSLLGIAAAFGLPAIFSIARG